MTTIAAPIAPPEPPSPPKLLRADDPELHAKRQDWMRRWFAFRGYTPHPGQASFHADTHRHRIMRKGRRGGGTTAGAMEAEVECQLWPPPGVAFAKGDADIGILAPTAKKTEILYGKVHDSLYLQGNLGRGHITKANYAPGDRRIELSWGARIFAWSLAEGLPAEGYGLRLLIVDEAQDMPMKVWWESLAPTLLETGGRAVLIGKAKGVGFRKTHELARANPNQWSICSFPSWENLVVPRSEIEEWRKQMPRNFFAQEVLAEFQDLGDLPFPSLDQIIDDELPNPARGPNPNGWYVDGWDLARKMDETVGITMRGDIHPHPVVEMHGARKEPWPVTQGRMAQRQSKWNSDVWIDATGVGDAVLGNIDIPENRIEPYIFTANSKSELLWNLQTMIEKGDIVIPNDPRLTMQLAGYEWDDKDLETDWVMALALAAMGIRKRLSPPGGFVF